MCQKKPWPRCAGHVGKQRDKAVADLIAVDRQISARLRAEANPDLFVLQKKKWALQADVERLNDEYDETPTGRATIARNMDGLTPSEIRQSGLGVRLAAATDRYNRKVAALKATEQGDPVGAAVILHYGPNAGWLQHTETGVGTNGRLTGHTWYRGGTNPAVLTIVDQHDEVAGMTQSGADETVTVTDITVEHPIVPGPTPGTYLMSMGNGSDDVLLTADESGQVHSAHYYDPGTQATYGGNFANEFANELSYDDQDLGYLDIDTSEYSGDTWTTPVIRRDATGTPRTVQVTGELVSASSHRSGPMDRPDEWTREDDALAADSMR